MSNAERVALKKATAACKVEATGMKFTWHWRKRQKYVQNCIIRTANQGRGNRHLASPQDGEYEGSPADATRGKWM